MILINTFKIFKNQSLFFLFLFIFSFNAVSQSDQYEEGKTLFKNEGCMSCHYFPGGGELVGPDLEGILDRRPEEELIRYINDPSSPEFNVTRMRAFPHLSADQIRSILVFLTDYQPPSINIDANADQGLTADEEESMSFTTVLFILLGSLIIIVLLLVSVKNSLKESISEPQESIFETIKRFWTEPISVAIPIVGGLIISFFVFVGGLYLLFNSLMSVGVVESYQPDQPIEFSHKIHALDNGIDCNYCHVSARHSKTASVPSANLCMNCHATIDKGSITGKKEIQKIYDAVGYDPNTKEYMSNYTEKPIEWIRVHQLPDLSYFNHAQHVDVANLECQQCHGNIEEKTVAQVATAAELNDIESNKKDRISFDHPTLTMGWCIDCHRQKEVDSKDNDYYLEMHERFKEKHGKKKFTVEMIGGLECGKCHY